MLTVHWWGSIIWPHAEARGHGKGSVWQRDIPRHNSLFWKGQHESLGGSHPVIYSPYSLCKLLLFTSPASSPYTSPWLCSSHPGPLLLMSGSFFLATFVFSSFCKESFTPRPFLLWTVLLNSQVSAQIPPSPQGSLTAYPIWSPLCHQVSQVSPSLHSTDQWSGIICACFPSIVQFPPHFPSVSCKLHAWLSCSRCIYF